MPLPAQMRRGLELYDAEAEELQVFAKTHLAVLTRKIAEWDPKVENYAHFDGPCPFLTCLETGPHDHPVCPECGVVRWGNMFCETCRSHWPKALQPLRSLLETVEEEQRTKPA